MEVAPPSPPYQKNSWAERKEIRFRSSGKFPGISLMTVSVKSGTAPEKTFEATIKYLQMPESAFFSNLLDRQIAARNHQRGVFETRFHNIVHGRLAHVSAEKMKQMWQTDTTGTRHIPQIKIRLRMLSDKRKNPGKRSRIYLLPGSQCRTVGIPEKFPAETLFQNIQVAVFLLSGLKYLLNEEIHCGEIHPVADTRNKTFLPGDKLKGYAGIRFPRHGNVNRIVIFLVPENRTPPINIHLSEGFKQYLPVRNEFYDLDALADNAARDRTIRRSRVTIEYVKIIFR